MLTIHNISDIPPPYTESFDGGVTKLLGSLAGSQKLYANIDIVPPGAQSTEYHAHSRQEEFFLILAGSGALVTNEGCRPVQKGDFVAKPAGLANAHRFDNTGTEPLEILDVGTVEKGDVAFYPETGRYRLRDEGIDLVKSDG